MKPVVVRVDAPADTVCVTLLRYASHPATFPVAEGEGARFLPASWTAERRENQVIYAMKMGPLTFVDLRFDVKADAAGSSTVRVTGEHGLRNARLKGALERWQAQRDVASLLSGVLAAVKLALTVGAAQPTATVRAAERLSVSSPARLSVGDRDWRAEVLDVSEGGLALVIFTPLAQAEADATLLLAHTTGEVELQHQGERLRAQVLVRRAAPGRGGVQVGLQVLNPDSIMPLLRKAVSRPRPPTQA